LALRDAALEVGVGIAHRMLEPAALARGAVKREGIGPVVAADFALKIQDAVPAKQRFRRRSKKRRAPARHGEKRRVFRERPAQPAQPRRRRLPLHRRVRCKQEALTRNEILHQRPRQPRVDRAIVGHGREPERMERGNVLYRAGHVGVVGEAAQFGVESRVFAQPELDHVVERGVERTEGIVPHIGEAKEFARHALVVRRNPAPPHPQPMREFPTRARGQPRAGTTEHRGEEHRLRPALRIANRDAEARVLEVGQWLKRVFARVGHHTDRHPRPCHERRRQRAPVGGLEK